MKTIVLTHAKTCMGKPGYRAEAKDVPGEWRTGVTVHEAVGELIRCIYEELGFTDRDLQVSLGHHWEEMENVELYQLLVWERRLLTIEGLPEKREVRKK